MGRHRSEVSDSLMESGADSHQTRAYDVKPT